MRRFLKQSQMKFERVYNEFNARIINRVLTDIHELVLLNLKQAEAGNLECCLWKKILNMIRLQWKNKAGSSFLYQSGRQQTFR